MAAPLLTQQFVRPDRQIDIRVLCPAYTARCAKERANYRDCLDVHDLPGIFHYWSNRYLRPKLEAFGFSTPHAMFLKYAGRHFHNGSAGGRVASIGAGNCQLEIELASHLIANGSRDFTIDCFDLNSDMLDRGRAAARQVGVAERINFAQVDLNTWNASQEYDAILANQILHHVLDLEHLFVEIKRSLKRGGSFVISDMIGRNGHQRWPEALATVREFWRKLPPSYRFSQRRLRYEETYEDHDCSGESFEGIRAQDILPLLLEHFHFELFIAFANLIDPFVDRDFGSNFDAAAWWDRRFIDQVNERDEKEIASGHIKPTHLLAVIGTDSSVPTLFHEPLSPRFWLRDPSAPAAVRKDEPAADDAANPWPHSDRTELEIACRRLKEAQDRIDWAARKAEDLHRELNERTAWAQRLDQEVLSCARKIEGLHQELEERTAWARQLDREVLSCARIIEGVYQELANRTAWARQLDQEVLSCARIFEGLYQELANRTAWAQRLDRELEERTPAHRKDLERLAWALAVDRRLHRPLDWAYRLVRRAVPGVVGGKAHAPAATLTP